RIMPTGISRRAGRTSRLPSRTLGKARSHSHSKRSIRNRKPHGSAFLRWIRLPHACRSIDRLRDRLPRGGRTNDTNDRLESRSLASSVGHGRRLAGGRPRPTRQDTATPYEFCGRTWIVCEAFLPPVAHDPQYCFQSRSLLDGQGKEFFDRRRESIRLV